MAEGGPEGALQSLELFRDLDDSILDELAATMEARQSAMAATM